jgi:hypothetical protein
MCILMAKYGYLFPWFYERPEVLHGTFCDAVEKHVGPRDLGSFDESLRMRDTVGSRQDEYWETVRGRPMAG